MKKTVRNTIALVVLTAVCAMSAQAFAAESDSAQASAGIVNINTATASELALLPGVGPAKAEAIVKYRANAPFKQIDQIMRVKGIGKKGFQNMKPYLSVDGPTTLKTKVKMSK
jgi:competence protein ComEA